MRIQICVYKIRHCCQKYYLNTSYEMYLNILTKLFFVILLLNTKSIIGWKRLSSFILSLRFNGHFPGGP